MTDLQKDSLTLILTSTYVTVNNNITEVEARDCQNIGFYEKREKCTEIYTKRESN